MTLNGLYIVKDEYFQRFPNSHWVDNKSETRPFYYAIKDRRGLYWMIPLTTQVERTKAKIARDELKHGAGNCIYYHVGLIAGRERGFNIGNMFPVTENYILREWTIGGTPYIVRDSNVIAAVSSKAEKFLSMVRRGAVHPQVDIMAVMRALLGDVQG